MPIREPDFTMGIEEEYLLVDRDSLDLVVAPQSLMDAVKKDLAEQVNPEYLQCQIEVATGVCATVQEAYDDLRKLREGIAHHAAKFNMAPIAASCHPFAKWKAQHHVNKERYNALRKDLAGVARRMLICGMHVHIGIEEPETRIDILNQLTYFLPHLLALSASSPFWQGDDTGLASYRLTIFDNLPRTGLPPQLNSWSEYELSVQTLVKLGLIEDSSKIWWDLRPSAAFPTIETRICDVQSRLENTLTLAAFNQALARRLWRLRAANQRWRTYDNFLLAENRWRAQRFGVEEGLIDFGRREVIPFNQLLDELIELIAEDAEFFDSIKQIEMARDIVKNGTSSDQQRKVFLASSKKKSNDEALGDVVRFLIDEFLA